MSIRLLFTSSRLGARYLRSISNTSKQSTVLKCKSLNTLVSRSSGSSRVGYRAPPPDDPIIEMLVDGTMTVVWCYLFWMFYHNGSKLINYGVNYSEFTDATDAELGIEE